MPQHPEARNLTGRQQRELNLLSMEFELFKAAHLKAERNALVKKWTNDDGTPRQIQPR